MNNPTFVVSPHPAFGERELGLRTKPLLSSKCDESTRCIVIPFHGLGGGSTSLPSTE